MTAIYKRSISHRIKPILAIALLIIFVVCLNCSVFAESEATEDQILREQIINEQMNSDEAKTIEEQMRRHSQNGIDEIIPGYDPQKILESAVKGDFELSLTGIINRGMMFLFKEIYLNISIMIKLVLLVILCAILKNLQTSFLSDGIGELAFYVCYIVVVSIMFVSFKTVLDLGLRIIDSMVAFMHATIPVLITLLVSGGNLASAGIFQPMLILIVEVAATILRNVFMPLILLSTILSIVDNISDKVQISKLSGFLKQMSGWALGIMLTLFIAIISLQGALGAVVDGVTSKTAKFAIGTFVPFAGKYLADAADAILGCTLLIKNASGIAAMVGIIAICLVPLLKILAVIILYRLTCILIEPISEKRIVNCMNEMANALTYVFGIVATVAFMFLVSITALISASNISSMIR